MAKKLLMILGAIVLVGLIGTATYVALGALFPKDEQSVDSEAASEVPSSTDDDATLDTDLTDISRSVPYVFINDANQGYSTSYLEYLRYALAEYLCSEYGVIFNPQSQQILKQMKRTLMYVSPPDLIMSKASVLNSSRLGGMTWAQVNIGKGFTP